MDEGANNDEIPLFCDRCTTELRAGEGNFYVVKIEAASDPTPPEISEAELELNPAQEIERLVAQTEQLSEQELLDQVYRRLTIYLCNPCYRRWIENPTG